MINQASTGAVTPDDSTPRIDFCGYIVVNSRQHVQVVGDNEKIADILEAQCPNCNYSPVELTPSSCLYAGR